ncbi:MAG: hypothetical protein ACC661_06595, partial [Verrucomicrobiales bacterium]
MSDFPHNTPNHGSFRLSLAAGAPVVGGVFGALLLMLLAGAGESAAQSAGSGQSAPRGTAEAVESEIARRRVELADAEAALGEADLLFSKGVQAEAVAQYRSVCLSLETSPIAGKLRQVALSKYERAATEYSASLAGQGRYDEAAAVLDALFDPEIGSRDGRARTLRKRIASDDYYNKALTPEHLAQVRKVEELLRVADGFVKLGDFDSASASYAQVLAYDTTNTAARRGLEEVDRLVARHGEASYDHTRAKMLREIQEQWAGVVPRDHYDLGAIPESGSGRMGDTSQRLRSKLNTIVFPSVSFSDASLAEVAEYLSQRSRELDTFETDPAKKGVNIIINDAGDTGMRSVRVSLTLSNIPMAEVLRYVADQAGVKYTVDSYAVAFVPPGAVTG